MCNKCLEYGHNSRICKKSKQIVLVTSEPGMPLQTNEPPTQANQNNKAKKSQKKRVRF